MNRSSTYHPAGRVAETRRPGAANIGIMIVCALTGAALVLLPGCDETKHYRTLSFFFDGVPLPPHLRPPVSPEAQALVDAAAQAKTVQTYYHTPFLERSCFGCHSQEQGFNLDARDPGLCRRCHEDYFAPTPGDWVHGPVAQQMCSYCHHPHKSENPGVLHSPQPNLCFQCHEEERVRRDPFHAQHIDDQVCSTCHDPHAAGNRLLLADGRTRHRRFGNVSEILTTPHNDWSKDTCTNCHDLQDSHKLRQNLDAQCVTCHDKVKDSPAEGKLHQAVHDGKCLNCHAAHRSAQPKLIRMSGQEMCASCHKLEELSPRTHRAMNRVDCLICHFGHSSPEPKLLRPKILDSFAARGNSGGLKAWLASKPRSEGLP